MYNRLDVKILKGQINDKYAGKQGGDTALIKKLIQYVSVFTSIA